MLSYVIHTPKTTFSSSPSLALPTIAATAYTQQHGVTVASPERSSISLNLNRNLNLNLISGSSNCVCNPVSCNANIHTKASINASSSRSSSHSLEQQHQQQPVSEIVDAMLANMNTAAATAVAAVTVDISDERTRLLSSTPTPPLTATAIAAAPLMSASTSAVAATAAGEAVMPIVTTATTTTATTVAATVTKIKTLPPAHPPNPSRTTHNSVIGSCNANANAIVNANLRMSNNNNNDSNIRNILTNTSNNNIVDGAIDALEYDADEVCEEAGTAAAAATAESDICDKQMLTRQTITTIATTTTNRKPKLSKLGSKSVGLKRVSFGSSKGSMVETLVFETPTPLSEHVEPNFSFEALPSTAAATAAADVSATKYGIDFLPSGYAYTKMNMDDSGIEVQEESKRSIVRVSIYQSSQPQQICPPEYITRSDDHPDNSFSSYNCNLDYMMATGATATGSAATAGIGPGTGATLIHDYDRQQSTDSGWDNPFRPGGDLSREADEIVNMIRGGKPITPTEDHTIGNGNAKRGAAGDDNCNGTSAGESVTKTNITQNQSAQNGTNSHKVQSSSLTAAGGGDGAKGGGKSENNGVTSLAHVSKQVVPGPTSASHVVIDEKKNKKKGCCVVQ